MNLFNSCFKSIASDSTERTRLLPPMPSVLAINQAKWLLKRYESEFMIFKYPYIPAKRQFQIVIFVNNVDDFRKAVLDSQEELLIKTHRVVGDGIARALYITPQQILKLKDYESIYIKPRKKKKKNKR